MTIKVWLGSIVFDILGSAIANTALIRGGHCHLGQSLQASQCDSHSRMYVVIGPYREDSWAIS